VLIVDDHEDMRVLVRAYLATAFPREILVAGEAGDGHHAIEQCAALHPDVVILDHDMPLLDGADAIPLIRVVSPESCIVLFTASPIDLDRAGVPDRHVDKREGLVPLGDAVRQCLRIERRRGVSGRASALSSPRPSDRRR
jgi:CheY-like chemotaxis protein